MHSASFEGDLHKEKLQIVHVQILPELVALPCLFMFGKEVKRILTGGIIHIDFHHGTTYIVAGWRDLIMKMLKPLPKRHNMLMIQHAQAMFILKIRRCIHDRLLPVNLMGSCAEVVG